MTEKMKNIVTVLLLGGLLFGLSIWFLLKPTTDFSDSERRKLATFPELTKETLSDGSFMSNFETYTQDQFPLRDSFRTLKSLASFYVFRQKDNNSIYVADGYASKLEYPLDTDSLANALSRFQTLYEQLMKDTEASVYLSVIPDKNYFLAEKNNYPAMDYAALFDYFKTNAGFATYIDIADLLELEDYYKTDTHWRQEKIQDVAAYIAAAMKAPIQSSYTENHLDNSFYGVYYGQAALPLPSEDLFYLTNETLANCTVFNYETNSVMSMYDMEKAYGKDPYEIFLSGPISLITIENPNATTDKELVIFRDSFGSSIAPYFAESYKKITLVDIRYLATPMVGRFVKITNQDVLFLYSSLVLNNSVTLK